MELRICSVASLLMVSSLLFQLAWGGSSGSVLFIDNQNHQYFRTPSTNDVAESQSLFLPEVGAAVSVLLGFAPPATISASASSKLNEVLMPNPFDRPRAVFLLEVAGIGDAKDFGLTNIPISNALRSKIIPSSDKANIQLPVEDDVSVVSLDDRPVDFSDNEISDFASWLGGSYSNDVSEPLNGHLTIPMVNGASVNLHMSKKPDREFTASLLALFRNIKLATEMHEDLSQSMQKPAELLMGTFNGIKALQENDDSEGVAQHALELLFVTVSKVFDSLQAAFKGQIVGVVLLSGTQHSESETMLNMIFTSRPSARWLGESKESINSTIAEVVLVRLTLAWLTGIILIVATLLGIYFLLNMPLTRDTLLYSNVKLD